MNIYCCRLIEQVWGTEYCIEKDFIWATDPEDAKQTICERWHIRKNKKGLQIEEIPVERATAQLKKRQVVKTATTWNSFLQIPEDYSYLGDETYYTCSKCKKEFFHIHDLCPHCGALLNN